MLAPSTGELQAAHTLLAEFDYELRPVRRGVTGRTLYINLTEKLISGKPVSSQMQQNFTGGRGYGLWLLWNAVTSETRWDDPENELVFALGPAGGITAYPGAGKTTVVTLSPQTGSVMDSSGGGYFGPYLKFAGWDALEIQGKAEQDVVIFIDGDTGRVTVEAAPLEAVDSHLLARQMHELYGGSDDRGLRSISVASAGQAAGHVWMCGLNLSYYDSHRKEVRYKQAARGGCGSVLRDKKIKAIVVRYSQMSGDSNGPADPALLRKAGQRINKEITEFDAAQNDMRGTGTPYLVEIMNRFDLLPVENFRFGADPKAATLYGEHWKALFDHSGPDGCWYGCTLGCAHGVPHFHLRSGPYAGQAVFVDGPEYETIAAMGSNCGIFKPEDVLELNFYADTYGIDSISAGNTLAFCMECWEYGILDTQRTGGLELAWGSADSALECLHQMARGEGFGVLVGKGIRFLKEFFAKTYGADPSLLHDIGAEVKGLETSDYMTKESLAQQGGYALASKGPQHDEAWLIFMELVHKQLPTFEAKAEALHFFPLFRTWFSLHGLCKLPWNDIIPLSNKTAAEPQKVPEHIENYTWLVEGVTGEKIDIDGILLQSERVYNFQRLFNLKMGFGRRKDDIPPYRMVGPVTVKEYESRAERYDKSLREDAGLDPEGMSVEQKIEALRRYRMDRYDKLVDAVYKRRGWDAEGVPTLETLQRLGLGGILELAHMVHRPLSSPATDA